MLQIRSVVYVSICFMLVQDVIHIHQVHGQYKVDLSSIEEDDETTPHNERQTEFATEPVPGPAQVANQEPDDANDQDLAGEQNLNDPSQEAFPDTEDDTQDDLATTRRAFSGYTDAAGVAIQWPTSKNNFTFKEEKKLSPDLVEKFTMPLLENRWKWDHRREALVKNFWFASFNEKGKRPPYRTLATTVLIPLNKDEENELLKPLLKLGWTKIRPSNTLKREFEFADFRQAFSFMTQVALISERISHFPDWYNFDSWVKITLCSKSIKSLTRKDIAIAQFASRVYERMLGRDDEILERSLTV